MAEAFQLPSDLFRNRDVSTVCWHTLSAHGWSRSRRGLQRSPEFGRAAITHGHHALIFHNTQKQSNVTSERRVLRTQARNPIITEHGQY